MVANDEAQQGIYPYLILIPQLIAATPRSGWLSHSWKRLLRNIVGSCGAVAGALWSNPRSFHADICSLHWPWRVLEPVRHISVLFGQQAGTPDSNLHPAFRSANRAFHISRSPNISSVPLSLCYNGLGLCFHAPGFHSRAAPDLHLFVLPLPPSASCPA